MKFLAILIGLAIERFWSPIQGLRRWHWFGNYVEWLHQSLKGRVLFDGPVGVILAIAPFALIVAWLQQIMQGGWWEIIGLAFGAFILVMSIGPTDLGAEVKAYLEARRQGDGLAERLCAEDIVGGDVSDEPVARTWSVIRSLLSRSHHWVFGALFWFMVLGPVGAVIYRLAHQLVFYAEGYAAYAPGFATAARGLVYILAWLPARLTSLGYAIMGSFVEGMRYWRNSATSWAINDKELLSATGLGALRLDSPDILPADDNVREAMELVRRTIYLWLTVIALMTIAGWW